MFIVLLFVQSPSISAVIVEKLTKIAFKEHLKELSFSSEIGYEIYSPVKLSTPRGFVYQAKQIRFVRKTKKWCYFNLIPIKISVYKTGILKSKEHFHLAQRNVNGCIYNENAGEVLGIDFLSVDGFIYSHHMLNRKLEKMNFSVAVASALNKEVFLPEFPNVSILKRLGDKGLRSSHTKRPGKPGMVEVDWYWKRELLEFDRVSLIFM